MLASKFEKEDFAFFSGTLRGIKDEPARWKTCVSETDNNLGEALGQLYVEKAFGADGKTRMKALVDALTVALGQDINGLEWMTPDTRAKALEKLKALGSEDRLPGQMARLLVSEGLPRGLHRQRGTGRSIRSEA